MKVNNKLVDIYKKDTIGISKLQQEYIKWFDNYTVNPLLSYFTLQDVAYLHKLAMSPGLNCNVKEKYRLIGELMEARGFKLIGGGTNRRAYECIYDDRIVAKVATDQVGFTSNLRELVNQNVLKPFCCKIFDVTPCGTLAIIEKIVPIKSVQEFQKYAQDIYDILYFKIRNNDIGIEDIGTRSMKNWGYRNGFGPVLLDYPTMYVLDPSKRFCRDVVNGQICGGTLDYDEGFNMIVCSECGRTHFARTLAKKDGEDISKLLQAVGYQQKTEKEQISMKFKVVNLETGEVESVREVGGKSNYANPNSKRNKFRGPKEVINFNEPQPDTKVPNIGFKDVVLGVYNPETGLIERESSVRPKVVEQKKQPVVTVNPTVVEKKTPVVPFTPVVEHFYDIDSQQSLSVEEAVRMFDKFAIDVVVDYETNNYDANYIEKVVSVLKKKSSNQTDYITIENAMNLFREVSVATLDLNMYEPGYISDKDLCTDNDNTLVAKLLQKVYPDMYSEENEDDSYEYCNNFAAFCRLINNVKNTLSFMESVVMFFRAVCYRFAFHDEAPGQDSYTFYKDVYDIIRNVMVTVFEDYPFNVNLSGTMTYNRANSFVAFRDKIKEMNIMFNNADKAAYNTDKTKTVTLTRSKDLAELSYCVTVGVDDVFGTEDNGFDSVVLEEQKEEEQQVQYEEVLQATPSEEEVRKESEKIEETISEENTERNVTDDVDDISDYSIDDDIYTVPIKSMKKKNMPTNTVDSIYEYNTHPMSKKQQQKFQKNMGKRNKKRK